jgi:hypothetical protein
MRETPVPTGSLPLKVRPDAGLALGWPQNVIAREGGNNLWGSGGRRGWEGVLDRSRLGLILGKVLRGVLELKVNEFVAGSGCSREIGQNSKYAITKGDLPESAATSATRYKLDTNDQAPDTPLLIK